MAERPYKIMPSHPNQRIRGLLAMHYRQQLGPGSFQEGVFESTEPSPLSELFWASS